MKILQYWTTGSSQVPARGRSGDSSGEDAQDVPWADLDGSTRKERQDPLLIQFRRDQGHVKKKIKNIYLLLIAIVSVLLFLGGCSSDIGDSNGGG